jgi:hypothetical protein
MKLSEAGQPEGMRTLTACQIISFGTARAARVRGEKGDVAHFEEDACAAVGCIMRYVPSSRLSQFLGFPGPAPPRCLAHDLERPAPERRATKPAASARRMPIRPS